MLSTDAYVYLNIADPVCAWATYRGVLVSVSPDDRSDDLIGSISLMSANMMRADLKARLNNELAVESVRRRKYPGRVSRLRGMYCFLDIESAERAAALWGSSQNHFRPEYLAELHLQAWTRRDRLDSNWITYTKRDENGFILTSELEQLDHYWEGHEYPGKVPIWETIVEGRMIVLGTELREKAYETIKRKFPKSLALLEIARLAAWVESDLGNIRAWLQDVGENIALQYLIDMRDANDAVFLGKLDKLKLEGHPINWDDLHREMKDESFGETPDLRPYGFLRPKTELPFIGEPQHSRETERMTPPPDYIRIAGRLNALENLLALLTLNRAQLDGNPSAWITQYIANLRKGTSLISTQTLRENDLARLQEETHRAILEFADLLEMHLKGLIASGQMVETGASKNNAS